MASRSGRACCLVAVLAAAAAWGCGNPGEGTVVVSPEARARLRGVPPKAPGDAGPDTGPAKAKGKAKAKRGPLDVKDRLRKDEGGDGP